jgi:hypothetical protein
MLYDNLYSNKDGNKDGKNISRDVVRRLWDGTTKMFESDFDNNSKITYDEYLKIISSK